MPFWPYPDNANLECQSKPIGEAKEGESRPYGNAYWDRSVLFAPGQPRSLYELFEQTATEYPTRDCLAYRAVLTPATSTKPAVLANTLTGISYSTVQIRRNAIGSALLALERAGRLSSPEMPANRQTPVEITFPNVPHYGSSNRLKGGARRGWGVGLWSKNRPEWQLIDMATHAYGLVGVSLYETLGPDVATYITNHCPLSVIFAEASKLPALLKMAPRCPSLRVIVSIDPISVAERNVLNQWASTVNLELLVLDELETWGSTEEIHIPPGPVNGVVGEDEMDKDRILTISYTSGTTGDPKGVVLTNINVTSAVISNGFGVSQDKDSRWGTGDEWRYMSILPLSHIYARFLEMVTVSGFGTICYTTGDPLRLVEDAQIIKPNLFCVVPRILNKIYAAITAQMNAGGLKGALLRRAVAAKKQRLKETGDNTHRLWDRLIRALLGGEVIYISSGAAPLSVEVHEFMRICFCCDVVQGCGMTETIGTMGKAVPWDANAPGTCGQIQPCLDVKLVDVPEMGYTHNDSPNPRGEICVQGSNVTPGYLHDPANTAKTIDKDGWLHTGDVGEIDSAGRLKIIDRIKNVVKLSQGEYVALEKLEGAYSLDPILAGLMVHADPTQSYLVALAVLDPSKASELITRVCGKTIPATNLQELEEAVKKPEVKQAVLDSFRKIAVKQMFTGFEHVKGIYLTLEPFPESLLTPTFKLKRNLIAKHYKAQIDEMFASGPRETGASAFAKL
ncbi:hypothetical protein BD324DRAFT_653376 [Kockovaella imperatae]|uniref:AMP-dependent synthetase/ligase domain-containing protein n=1 Tax=Kockovaella imperatae TaxID=4999 RepID=A0A1Y1U9B3_9TREE|nr:hypothetical protein BD324DRAFT_653376 [Kockovaella imperatae]ORX34097.1 hypothetical protein BD324DRAFT_653376 [Kockovaella imperatae]